MEVYYFGYVDNVLKILNELPSTYGKAIAKFREDINFT